MAAYKVDTFTTSDGALDDVLAALEVQLETLDSTTNVLRLIDVAKVRRDGADWVGMMIYDIA